MGKVRAAKQTSEVSNPDAAGSEAKRSDEDKVLQARCAKLAIEALTQAVEHGWKDVAHMESDPDLAPIREYAGYDELLTMLQTKE